MNDNFNPGDKIVATIKGEDNVPCTVIEHKDDGTVLVEVDGQGFNTHVKANQATVADGSAPKPPKVNKPRAAKKEAEPAKPTRTRKPKNP